MSQSISNLDADRVIASKTVKPGAPVAAYPARVAIGQIVSGSASLGYTVTILNSQAATTSATFYAVGTVPGGQTLSAGDQVLVMFRGAANDAPFIFTGGGGGGSATVTAFSGYLGYFSGT